MDLHLLASEQKFDMIDDIGYLLCKIEKNGLTVDHIQVHVSDNTLSMVDGGCYLLCSIEEDVFTVDHDIYC